MVTRLAVVTLLVLGVLAAVAVDAEARERRTPRYCSEVVARAMVGGPCHEGATRQERRSWRRGLKGWQAAGQGERGPSWVAHK